MNCTMMPTFVWVHNATASWADFGNGAEFQLASRACKRDELKRDELKDNEKSFFGTSKQAKHLFNNTKVRSRFQFQFEFSQLKWAISTKLFQWNESQFKWKYLFLSLIMWIFYNQQISQFQAMISDISRWMYHEMQPI